MGGIGLSVEASVEARQVQMRISNGSKSYGMHIEGTCEEECE